MRARDHQLLLGWAFLRRYTKFVLYSKWFLGVFAVVMMVSLIGWPLLTKDRSGIRVSFIGSATKPGQSIVSPVMHNPQYQGSDAKGQQFKVLGKQATQKTADLVIIDEVEGQLLRPNGGWMSVSADTAEYQQKLHLLELIGNVTTSDDEGYIFLTPRATINTDTSDVVGKETVEGTGPKGNIVAIGFKIMDNGKRITFGGSGRVTVRIEKMQQDS